MIQKVMHKNEDKSSGYLRLAFHLFLLIGCSSCLSLCSIIRLLYSLKLVYNNFIYLFILHFLKFWDKKKVKGFFFKKKKRLLTALFGPGGTISMLTLVLIPWSAVKGHYRCSLMLLWITNPSQIISPVTLAALHCGDEGAEPLLLMFLCE